jgi:hypothetical protein
LERFVMLPKPQLGVPAIMVLLSLVLRSTAGEEAALGKRAGPDGLAQNRRQFARALAKVKEGVRANAVLKILGKPDDVRTPYDTGGISTFGTKEIWCYGTNGHLGFPTLGCVYLDTEGNVQYVFGGQGDPPPVTMFPEAQLRDLLRLIDQTPPLAGYRYDPLRVIRIVNTLQPLGKEKALAAVDEYLRVASDRADAREGLFVVLRLLFDIPKVPGHMPAMHVGAPWPWPGGPEGGKRLPRFPVLLLDDVPLLLVSGYVGFGDAEPVERHVSYFRKGGTLRSRPLAPADAPLQVYEKFQRSYLPTYRDQLGSWACAQVKLMVINQLLRLVRTVYRCDADAFDYLFAPEVDVPGRWEKVKVDFAKLRVRWAPQEDRYKFRDGTVLPERPLKQYRRSIWNLQGIAGKAQVILERRDARRVRVIFAWSGPTGSEPKGLTIQALAGKDGHQPLGGAFPASVTGAVGPQVSFEQSQLVDLLEGDQLRVRVSLGGRTRTSPVYRP